jgi:hypothetical protein
VKIVPVTAERWDDFVELFSRPGFAGWDAQRAGLRLLVCTGATVRSRGVSFVVASVVALYGLVGVYDSVHQ